MRVNEKVTLPNGNPARLFEFASAGEMADWVNAKHPAALTFNDVDWAGGTWEEATSRAHYGQQDLVARSDKLMGRMESIANLDGHAFANVAAVAGGVANVPAYLANSPMAMRQRRRVLSQQAPMTVLASQWVQAGVEHSKVERRGAAILALVRKLSEFRPVSLHVFTGLGGQIDTLTTFRVETAPLDLARAAWALGSPNVIRHFVHACHGKANGKGYKGGFELEGDAEATAALTGADDWIATPNVSGGDFEDDESAADWVLDELKKHMGDELMAA